MPELLGVDEAWEAIFDIFQGSADSWVCQQQWISDKNNYCSKFFLWSINAHKYNVYNGDKNEVIDYVITLQGTKIYHMFSLLTLLQHGVLSLKEHVQACGC